MDSEHYKTMAYSNLNYEYYEHLEKNPHRTNMIAYCRKLIDKHKTDLTEKEESDLLQFESKDSNFYGLLEVHKSTSSIVMRSFGKTILSISMVNTIDNEREQRLGQKFAPFYGTLMIGYLEETLYRKVSNEFGQQFREYFIKFWNRFLAMDAIP